MELTGKCTNVLDHCFGSVEREEVAPTLHRDQPGARDVAERLLSLVMPRPVAITIDQEHRHSNSAIDMVGLSPQGHVAYEVEERLVVAAPLAGGEHLFS